MCGIVGYIGKKQSKDILISCLEKLEYRGYDSAGIAVSYNKKIKYAKAKGKISNLRKISDSTDLEGFMGIAHTRWATHGEPSVVNSHPHFNSDKTIAVVHNGIIENYEHLKKHLMLKGYSFLSETDTEVIPHLIDYNYKGDFLDSIINTAKSLEGSFSIGIICTAEPEKIFALRKDSPLIVGEGSNGNFIASDIPAIQSETNDVYYMDEGEIAVIEKGNITFLDMNKDVITKEKCKINYHYNTVEKSGYAHFMLKEIHDQPKAVYNTLCGRLNNDLTVNFSQITKKDILNTDKIYIVACGTAYNAGVIGKYVTEKLSGIPVEVEYASEFRYRKPLINSKTLVLVISQSGETADTLAALRHARKNGATVIAITNVAESTIPREADDVFYTYAGQEISVASTKAYLTQLTAIYLFSVYVAEITEHTPQRILNEIKAELINIPEKINVLLKSEKKIEAIAKSIFNEKDIYYTGRALDYAVALEGALKLKETSYIHAETYAAGELKHGPIALIDKNTVVIAINTSKSLSRKTDSNIKELIARGAKTIGVIPEGFEEFENSFKEVIHIPKTHELLYPLLSAVPLQLLAYYVALKKGCDVDKPRNLAKSVTVE